MDFELKTLVMFFILVLAAGCSRHGRDSSTVIQDVQEETPSYSLEEVTHYQYEDGMLRVKVFFDRGDFYDDRQELRVENCTFVYYDIDGYEVSTGRSKRAVLYQNSSLLVAEDDVVIVSQVNRGMLETDYLEWRGVDSQFVTDRFVTITRENGDTLQGIGMITDVALNYVTIKRDVKGSFRAD